MVNWFSKSSSNKSDEDFFICLLGPSGSGKSTLSKLLKTKQPVDQNMLITEGIEISDIPDFGKTQIKVIDNAGQAMYQHHFWRVSIQHSHIILFILDATIRDERSILNFKNQLEYVFGIMDPWKPLGILLNKQDLLDLSPYSAKEANILYELSKYGNKTQDTKIFEISSKLGQGLNKLIEWIACYVLN